MLISQRPNQHVNDIFSLLKVELEAKFSVVVFPGTDARKNKWRIGQIEIEHDRKNLLLSWSWLCKTKAHSGEDPPKEQLEQSPKAWKGGAFISKLQSFIGQALLGIVNPTPQSFCIYTCAYAKIAIHDLHLTITDVPGSGWLHPWGGECCNVWLCQCEVSSRASQRTDTENVKPNSELSSVVPGVYWVLRIHKSCNGGCFALFIP